MSHKHSAVSPHHKIIALYAAIIVAVCGLAVLYMHNHASHSNSIATLAARKNPLAGKAFYIDNSRPIRQQQLTYEKQNDVTDADLAAKVADQPGTTWLTGPTDGDPQANHDISEVARTSNEALEQERVPIYELYAVPGRDACGGYSKAGWQNNQQYMAWLNRIVGALKTNAVFSIEADAVAQAAGKSCLSSEQVTQRNALLKQVTTRLHDASNVLATYLDAGNSAWFSNPNDMVTPLKQAGVDDATGIAVNVSSFVATPEITHWAQQLSTALGSDKGIIIDTSRNGNGMPPADVTGDARWCNPAGRSLGPAPSTSVNQAGIDAYFWGKVVGESDGTCGGYPPAGTFVPELAIDLARNASSQ